MQVLVTGGVRSGKSRHAEALVRGLAGEGPATYVAPGPAPDPVPGGGADPDWAARVAAHRARRPVAWTTLETTDVAGAVRGAAPEGPVLVDCLGTWLTALLDDAEAWEWTAPRLEELLDERLHGLTTALGEGPGEVVLVTNEVGLGVVPAHRSGRVFRDLLGTVNQRVGGVVGEVHLVVAGRVLVL
ncbi:bifunctional adenosylcobinamide kinase/adenosylcobinamide-phosphate guanylyltransferase [Nocardioides acrostichi]|uniref:Adenosylcobinamide kinase n=1 Tax=Nocardioides acrostichi TaxID=2784339 RepID=A0A930V2R6_9ACTN|nr:bifunctional adenosylcobinamide kinase/adenosylcobinamide-phosphate guanylyltransferase [Nocardioides acrostichi]MBF4162690.1 bifunctional adenosylcobinamide kinase/adenosylcobinamide-phosphate guanylyltransferase [Nocardioides acrostichi]